MRSKLSRPSTGVKVTNKYLEKIAEKATVGEVGKRFARRAGRLGKGVLGVGVDLAETFTGKRAKDVMAEGSKVWVKHPLTGTSYKTKLPDYQIEELKNYSDSKKIKYLSDRYGKNHDLVKKVKNEINKRDVLRIGVGVAGAGLLKKKVGDYLEERRMYNDYYNV